MNDEEGNESDVASEAHAFEHDHRVMDRENDQQRSRYRSS